MGLATQGAQKGQEIRKIISTDGFADLSHKDNFKLWQESFRDLSVTLPGLVAGT